MACFKALIMAGVTVLGPVAATAQCRVCDEIIEVNSSYAACFAAQFDRIMDDLSRSDQGRTKVDMASCQGGAEDKDRGGLLTMPSIIDAKAPAKSVYLLDEAYALCLRDLLNDHEGDLDPTATFDLFEQCAR